MQRPRQFIEVRVYMAYGSRRIRTHHSGEAWHQVTVSGNREITSSTTTGSRENKLDLA